MAVLLLEKTLFKNSETLPYQKTAKFYSSKKDLNLLILGSSRAEGNYIPSILNPNGQAQNFGLPGTGNKIWYHMLVDELSNSFSRKVIVNIDPARKPINNGQDYNYSYYLKLPKNSNLYSALNKSTKAKLLPNPLFYLGSVKGFIAESLKDYANLTSITDHGFKGNTNSLSKKQFESLLEDTESFRVGFNGNLWKSTFERIENSKDTVYFVLAPIYEKRLQQIDYSAFKFELKQLSKSYQQIKFYDFSNSIKEKQLFYDPEHLNYKGAVNFSKMLKDSIQANFPKIKSTN